MLIRRPDDIPSSEITPERDYLSRRRFLGTAAAAAVSAGAAPLLGACTVAEGAQGDQPNTWEQITSYNNFYEYGTGKEDPAANAPGKLRVRPWTEVYPEDIQDLATYVLGHRIWLGPHAASHGLTTDPVIADVVDKVPIP